MSYRDERSNRVPGDGLVINFFPAAFSASQISVWAGRWSSTEAIDALVAGYPGLSTWRDPDDSRRFYAWHTNNAIATAPTELKAVTISHDESPLLFQRLMLDAMRARLTELGFVEKNDGFVNYASGKNLLGAVPALTGVAGGSIGIFAKVIVEGFFTKSAAGKLVSGIVVDVLYTTRMDVNAAEWVAAGIGEALSGVYVKLIPGSPEAARFPQFAGRAIGRVNGIRRDRCVLDDPRDPALAEMSLDAVAPEPTRANLAAYLRARHAQAYEAGEKALLSQLRELVMTDGYAIDSPRGERFYLAVGVEIVDAQGRRATIGRSRAAGARERP